MKSVPFDLFMLMSSLSQVENGDTAIRLFCEAINSFSPEFSLHHTMLQSSQTLEVGSLSGNHGYLELHGDPVQVDKDFPALLRNAVQMLGVILERNRNNAALKEESHRLQTLVDEKVASIRRSEALLSETQRLSRIGGWDWNADTGRMYWTDECYRIHGLEPPTSGDDSRDLVSVSAACYAETDIETILAAFSRCGEKGEPYDLVFPFKPYAGSQLWIRTTAKAVVENGRVSRIVGNIMDITEQKRAQEVILSSLAEKEALIRELYHRTKNNMSVICALLDLKAGSIEDVLSRSILKDMGNRIRSMALVHSRLYRSKNLSRIDLGEYIKELVELLLASHGKSGLAIASRVEVETASVLIDIAVPVGLFVNEAVTNALKHAFPVATSGNLIVELHQLEGSMLRLVVADDGVGIPEGFDPAAQGSLGWMVMTGIAKNQLNGDLTVRREGGLRFELVFSTQRYEERV